jgi:hypothetical protein
VAIDGANKANPATRLKNARLSMIPFPRSNRRFAP